MNLFVCHGRFVKTKQTDALLRLATTDAERRVRSSTEYKEAVKEIQIYMMKNDQHKTADNDNDEYMKHILAV